MNDHWDLDALDQAATRARLTAWLPLAVVALTALGYVGTVGLAVAAVALGGGAAWVLPIALPTLLPLGVGLAVRVWQIRAMVRHLPGSAPTWTERLARWALIVGLVPLTVGVLGAGLRDDLELPLLLTLQLVWAAPFAAIQPPDRWSPPRWTSALHVLAMAVSPAVSAALLWWTPIPLAAAAAVTLVPWFALFWLTRRRLRAILTLRAQGRHAEAVARLTTWASLGLPPVTRATVLFHAGRVEESLELCLSKLRRSPRQHWAPTLLVAGEAARLLGRREQAVALTDALLAVAPERPEGYLLAASLTLDASGPPDQALALVERAATHLDRVTGLSAAGALQQAALAVWRARLGLLRATALARAGQPTDAGRELDGALTAIDPTDRPAAARLRFESLSALTAVGRDEAPTRVAIGDLDPNGIGGWLLRSADPGASTSDALVP